MKLTITYKNGNTIEQSATAVWMDDNKLCYQMSMNPTPIFVKPVMIPLENIKSYKVIEEATK